jgi:prepilin-type N-terminal cleavage/methylation domain-containing protein
MSPISNKNFASSLSTEFCVARGFTLIEIAIVLVILTLLLVIVAPLAIGQAEINRRATTRARMDNIDKALVLFVQRNQRLPCPADGTLDSTNALNGAENRNAAGDCVGNQQTGIVPFRSLGLGEEDATDGRNLRFTFRIGQYFARDSALNTVLCDPVGGDVPTTTATGPTAFRSCKTAGCTATTTASCTSVASFLNQFGLTVRDVTSGGYVTNSDSNPSTTGAAYVLISHGTNQGGAYTPSGVLTSASPASGTNEAFNHNNQTLRIPPLFYSEGSENNSETTAHFDDVVRRPTVQFVIDAAGLGPRIRP